MRAASVSSRRVPNRSSSYDACRLPWNSVDSTGAPNGPMARARPGASARFTFGCSAACATRTRAWYSCSRARAVRTSPLRSSASVTRRSRAGSPKARHQPASTGVAEPGPTSACPRHAAGTVNVDGGAGGTAMRHPASSAAASVAAHAAADAAASTRFIAPSPPAQVQLQVQMPAPHASARCRPAPPRRYRYSSPPTSPAPGAGPAAGSHRC
jgi:hypothetical protein